MFKFRSETQNDTGGGSSPKSIFGAPNSEKQLLAEEFRQLLDGINEIITTLPPEKWWRNVYKHLRKLEQNPDLSPAVRDFVDEYAGLVISILEDELHTSTDNPNSLTTAEGHSQRTLEVIHNISHLLTSTEFLTPTEVEISHQSIDQILASSDRFALKNEEGRQIFRVFSNSRQKWFNFPLPPSSNMVHKGGFPRVVLKILAGADPETIEAELPPNDYDVIAQGSHQDAYRDATAMGVDIEGVEVIDKIDFQELCFNRDVDLNCAFLGKDGLTYSAEAFEAARTGEIKIKGLNRGIYGADLFRYQGIELVKNRGVVRLLKMVAERKAKSFEITPLNKQVDLGVYWLVLARKFSKKSNFPDLMERFYALGQKIGQVHVGEEDIFDVMDRVHAENLFFDFDEASLDQVGVARWLNEKLLKYTHSTFRQKYKIGGSLDLDRREGDTEPETISLDDFVPSGIDPDDVKAKWEAFLQRCRDRRKVELKPTLEVSIY